MVIADQSYIADEGVATRVRPGTRVVVRFDDGETLEVTIRQAGEAGDGTISPEAPLTRALSGGTAGDRRTYVVRGIAQAVTILRVLPRG
jgi:transcription elongation GreA/GreB family factor